MQGVRETQPPGIAAGPGGAAPRYYRGSGGRSPLVLQGARGAQPPSFAGGPGSAAPWFRRGSGGRSPPVSQGGFWGAARPPNIGVEQIFAFFFVKIIFLSVLFN